MLSQLFFLLSILPFTYSYRLVDEYQANQFGDKFDFFTGSDPTNGFVQYVDKATAEQNGLFKMDDTRLYIGVDYTNVQTDGRQSVRIESKANYTHGLFILDLQHMPSPTCGTWPAFWLLGSGADWPQNGEIDVIEGVNTQNGNSMALHTSDGCGIVQSNDFSGQILSSNCYVKAEGQFDNQGCQIFTDNFFSYGDGFNEVGGGIYATEWTSDFIKIWYFRTSDVPEDIKNGNPDPNSWPKPLSKFAGACTIDDHFRDQKIIMKVAFCGDWAGSVWGQGVCAEKAPDCESFVRDNPGEFADSYWLINSLKVYQQ